MKNTKIVVLLFVLSLLFVFNMVIPQNIVVADSDYTITFAAMEGHTLSLDGGHLKIDNEYVDFVDSNNNVIGNVSVTGTSASISVTGGKKGTLNYNSANKFTLYNTNGHVAYTMGEELDSSIVFNVEDYNGESGNPTASGKFEVKYLRDAGDVWYKFGNGTETKLTSNTNNIEIVPGKMTIKIEDRTVGAAMLFINGTNQNVDRDNFKTGYTFNVTSNDNVYFEIEYINDDSGNGGNNNSNTTASVTVTAGAGTYDNNKTYDDEIDFYINGSMWDHSNSISYDSADEDTKVDFRFETLWINRYYDDIVINGTSYKVNDYLNFDDRTQWLIANHGTQQVGFDIPNVAKADSYNIVVKHGRNIGKTYFATFLWTADPNQANGENYIGNSRLEFVKAVYEVGGVKYTVNKQDLEGKMVRDGEFKSVTSADGFLNYGVVADVNYDDGSLTLPGRAEVTMRVVPDYGYQVVSVNGGKDFKTTDSGVSEFTLTVEEGTAGYFQATVEKVENTVNPTSEKVKAGNISLGENASTDIKNGTVRLSVEDVELSSDKISSFEKKANEAGDYLVTNYLDINLNKVLYRGSSDNVWAEEIHHLTDKALITLQLEDGVDISNIIIVHNIDNGDEFEIIPIEKYDEESNTISFYTDSFSNYAIASKKTTTSNVDKNETSSNPSTGDNIILVMSLFATCTLGLFVLTKLNKKF